MATLTPLKVDELGSSALSFTTLTLGTEADDFVNTGKEFIVLKGHATVATTSVTFVAQVTNVRHPTFGNTTKANVAVAVAAAATVIVGPFKPSAFNDTDNKVKMTTVMASGTAPLSAKGGYLDYR